MTTSAGLGQFGLPAGTTTSYVFSEDGRMLGGVTELPDGATMISMVDEPNGSDDPWSPINGATMLIYDFDGTSATLSMTVTWEPARINEPLDESLFD